MIKRRKKLTDANLLHIKKLGETIGKKSRLDIYVKKANMFFEKNRRIAFPLLVLGIALLLVLSSLLEKTIYTRTKNLSTQDGIPNTFSMDTINNSYSKEILQAIIIADSIQSLYKRGNLSHDDSIYIYKGNTYLLNINKKSHEE